MKYNSDDIIMVNLLQEAVESKGCRLTDVDFDNSLIKFDGPDEVVAACARAVAEILD